jgi:hypothetical protein
MMNKSWQEPGRAEILCAGPDYSISGQPAKLMCEREQPSSDEQALTGYT